MRGKMRVVALGATVAGLISSGFIFSQAYAGNNGQHVKVCDAPANVTRARVTGVDHTGAAQSILQFFNPGVNGRCNELGGYWWKGTVTIDWRGSDDALPPVKTTTCEVPTEQSDSDYTECLF
jgi:hypothetical protein